MSDRQTIVDKVIELLTDQFNSTATIKAYFYGDPIVFAYNSLPCIVVNKTATEIHLGPTGHDERLETITIKVVANKMADVGVGSNETALKRWLEDIAEGQDSTTNEYKANTICGVIRKNFSLDKRILNQIFRIEYFDVQRPEGQITAEAQITFTVNEYNAVSGRS